MSVAQSQYTLCFVTDEKGELFIHADKAGLAALISSLERLKRGIEAGTCEHEHLFTAAWGGKGLSADKGIQDGMLINHVKIFGWTEEWAKKHGFKR